MVWPCSKSYSSCSNDAKDWSDLNSLSQPQFTFKDIKGERSASKFYAVLGVTSPSLQLCGVSSITRPPAAVINSIASCTGYLNTNRVGNLHLLQMKAVVPLSSSAKDFVIFLSWWQAVASKTAEKYGLYLSLPSSLTRTLWPPSSSQVWQGKFKLWIYKTTSFTLKVGLILLSRNSTVSITFKCNTSLNLTVLFL